MNHRKKRFLLLLLFTTLPVLSFAQSASENNCPSFVYLKAPASSGLFSSTTDLLIFKLEEQTTEKDVCTYRRPQCLGLPAKCLDDEVGPPPYFYHSGIGKENGIEVTMIAELQPQTNSCGGIVGAIKCKNDKQADIIFNCPQVVKIGPVVKVSYGDYGKGAPAPMPSEWIAQDDQMTLKMGTAGNVKSRMVCDYTGFNTVRLKRR